MASDEQLSQIYQRIRDVEEKLVDKVAAVDKELASHVAECGQLRERLAKSHESLHGKVDSQGSQLTQIDLNLAKIAGSNTERRLSRAERIKFWGLVAALAAAIAAIVQLFS